MSSARPATWSSWGWLSTTRSRRRSQGGSRASSTVSSRSGSGPPSTSMREPRGPSTRIASPWPTSSTVTVRRGAPGRATATALDQHERGHPDAHRDGCPEGRSEPAHRGSAADGSRRAGRGGSAAGPSRGGRSAARFRDGPPAATSPAADRGPARSGRRRQGHARQRHPCQDVRDADHAAQHQPTGQRHRRQQQRRHPGHHRHPAEQPQQGHDHRRRHERCHDQVGERRDERQPPEVEQDERQRRQLGRERHARASPPASAGTRPPARPRIHVVARSPHASRPAVAVTDSWKPMSPAIAGSAATSSQTATPSAVAAVPGRPDARAAIATPPIRAARTTLALAPESSV